MSVKILRVIGFLTIVTFFSQNVFAQPVDTIHPKVKYEIINSQEFFISNSVNILGDNNFSVQYKATVDSVKKTFSHYGRNEQNTTEILLIHTSDFSKINSEHKDKLNRPESYYLKIGTDKIIIKAKDTIGLLNGLSTLEALVEEQKGKLHSSDRIDYPDLKMRVLHISMWPCAIDDFKATIRLARLEHFNTLIWLNHFGVKLKSLKHLKISNKNRWTIEQFKEMVTFVKQNGLEIIPELKLLSHQKKFMGNAYPQYMYNKATYDPRKKELYKNVVFPAIDEVLTLTGATRFHIGHDEVAGWHEWHYRKKILNKGEQQLPPELFLEDVYTLHKYLKLKDVETWMWSDMLYTKAEFPSMKKAGANLTGMNGYSALREKIPKDIIMNAWHYHGDQKKFPTARILVDNGYEVLGATWKNKVTTRNFANYIADMPNNGDGMIATTWFSLTGKKKSEVQNIIRFSGEAFWNAK